MDERGPFRAAAASPGVRIRVSRPSPPPPAAARIQARKYLEPTAAVQAAGPAAA
jgi:hypothetical protein